MQLPFYSDLDPRKPAYRHLDNFRDGHVVDRLIALRRELDQKIPTRSLERNLLIGSWNIREFDSKKFGYRTEEAMIYIAEIISRFDLIAIQEVVGDLRALIRLREYLGDYWDFTTSIMTAGALGNDERLAFLFDTRKLVFSKVAGQIVIPPIMKREKGRKPIYVPAEQPARSPFLLSFRSGWVDFAIVNVHVYYGTPNPNNPRRVQEIRNISNYLAKFSGQKFSRSRNMILLGDFNIFSPEDETYDALLSGGFRIPEELQRKPSNAKRTRFFDQIAVLEKTQVFEVQRAGVFNFFDTVFRDEDEEYYARNHMIGERYFKDQGGVPKTDKRKMNYYRLFWRTFQMSDHLPMWLEVKSDFTDDYLAGISAGKAIKT